MNNNNNSPHLSPQRRLPAVIDVATIIANGGPFLTSAQALTLLQQTQMHRQQQRHQEQRLSGTSDMSIDSFPPIGDDILIATSAAEAITNTTNSTSTSTNVANASSTSVAYEDRMCRICRTGAADSPEAAATLIRSPCRCKGSVGYVHGRCLMRWQHVRHGATECEICHSRYEFGPDVAAATAADKAQRRRRRFRRLMQPYCLGRIVKCLLNFVALSTLTYLNMQQMQTFIEATGRYVDNGVVDGVVVGVVGGGGTAPVTVGTIGGSGAPVPVVLMALYLMGVGVGNCTYVEWTMHSVHKIGLVLEHWWSRDVWADGDRDGGSDDDDAVDGDEMLFGSRDSLGWTFLGDVM